MKTDPRERRTTDAGVESGGALRPRMPCARARAADGSRPACRCRPPRSRRPTACGWCPGSPCGAGRRPPRELTWWRCMRMPIATPISRLLSSAQDQVRRAAPSEHGGEQEGPVAAEHQPHADRLGPEGVGGVGVEVQGRDGTGLVEEREPLGEHADHAQLGADLPPPPRPPAVARDVAGQVHRVAGRGVDTRTVTEVVLQPVGPSGDLVGGRLGREAGTAQHGQAGPRGARDAARWRSRRGRRARVAVVLLRPLRERSRACGQLHQVGVGAGARSSRCGRRSRGPLLLHGTGSGRRPYVSPPEYDSGGRHPGGPRRSTTDRVVGTSSGQMAHQRGEEPIPDTGW